MGGRCWAATQPTQAPLSIGISSQGVERVNGDRVPELALPELAPRSLRGAHGMLSSLSEKACKSLARYQPVRCKPGTPLGLAALTQF